MKLTADKHPNSHLVPGCGCVDHCSKRFLAVGNDAGEQRQPALHIIPGPDELQLTLVGLHVAELCLRFLQDLLSCCNAILQQAHTHFGGSNLQAQHILQHGTCPCSPAASTCFTLVAAICKGDTSCNRVLINAVLQQAQSPACMAALCPSRRTEKWKVYMFMCFDHNGSLLRRRPRARAQQKCSVVHVVESGLIE